MKHELVHGARVAEANLDLCRMDVDVDAARVDLEEKHVRGMAFAMQDVAVGLAQRMREQLVAHEATVHVDELRVARGARVRGRPGEA